MSTSVYGGTTFTAAGSTISDSSTSWTRIDFPGGSGAAGDKNMGEQCLRTFATFNAASGTATLAFAITEKVSGLGERIVYFETCSVVGDATRVTTLDNSGTVEFVARCTWQTTNRDTIDMLGHLREGTKCYIGCTALATATSVKVRITPTKNAG